MDLIEILRALSGLAFVLGLIALCAYVARRSPLITGLALTPKVRGRLGIAERVMLDPRRQLVIIRDGEREHVVLLGATSETLIESRSAAKDIETPALKLAHSGSSP